MKPRKWANDAVGAEVLDLTDDSRTPNFPPADLATLIFVLSSIEPSKHETALRNLAKLVKVGGSVFFRDYGALDYAMIRFGGDAKISDRFYARQDGTRAFYFFREEVSALFRSCGLEPKFCEYLHKTTSNHEKQMTVARVFVQGRFVRIK